MLTMMTALSVSPTMPETMLATTRITTSGFARSPRPVRSRRKRLPVSTRLGPNSVSRRAASTLVSPRAPWPSGGGECHAKTLLVGVGRDHSRFGARGHVANVLGPALNWGCWPMIDVVRLISSTSRDIGRRLKRVPPCYRTLRLDAERGTRVFDCFAQQRRRHCPASRWQDPSAHACSSHSRSHQFLLRPR
jgi:hypothetical protein